MNNSWLFLFLFSAGGGVVANAIPHSQPVKHLPKQNLEDSLPYIYGGVNTTIYAHPYLAAILRNDFVSNSSYLLCTGTILSKKWVLIPSVCTYEVNLNYITVLVGSTDAVTGDSYTVTEKTVNATLALLKVDGKFIWSEKTKSINIPLNPPKTKKSLTVLGYQQAGNGTFGLVEGVMTQLDDDKCQSLYQDFVPSYYWIENTLCAYNRWKVTVCQASPHFGAAFVNQGVVYGVDSVTQYERLYAQDCSPYALPSVYGNVFASRSWILDTLGNDLEDF